MEYRPLPCKSLLNENKNPALPFSWTINPYRGCEFACTYCYARATHAYLDHDPKDFERRIYVKQGAAHVLATSLRPELLYGRPVTIGTATDPYQGAERHFRITRGVLEVLSRYRGLSVSITTKSPLVVRDIDLLRRIREHSHLRVNVSLITLRPGLARILEPRAPVPRRRIETIQRLVEAGIPVALFCMPILPGITDRAEDLRAVLGAARAAGASYAFGNTVHLEKPIRPTFLPMLRRHFPQLYGHYQDLYGGRRYAPARETERIDRIFTLERDRAGFPAETERTLDDRTAALLDREDRPRVGRSAAPGSPANGTVVQTSFWPV
ncbi:MAG: radical SAM protein [Candidatus Eisenbacteria bacterium]|uniref:Radical SAM protein n=1 Tax=Eiseniibacteriota bacterium TaxID=2212470 RepID=A0A956RP32_UNCEI|nr:radical SAM protein [Candidatus Eisenbacteria bacterium]